MTAQERGTGEFKDSKDSLSLVERENPRVLNLLDIANRAAQEEYPEAYVLPPQQIWWLSRNEFKRIYESLPPTHTFTQRNLRAIGAGSDIPPYKPTYDMFSRKNVFPPELYFVADSYKAYSGDLKERAWAEYTLIRTFLDSLIFHSRVSREIGYNPEIKEILEHRLDYDLKQLPRFNPAIRKEELVNLIEGYRNIVALEEAPKIEVQGGSVKYLSQFRSSDGKPYYETLLEAGRTLDTETTILLGTKPLRKALVLVAETYPEDARDKVRALHRKMLAEDNEEKSAKKTRAFFHSIGIFTNQDIFQAFHNSTIVPRYIEAKKKRKNLTYPI